MTSLRKTFHYLNVSKTYIVIFGFIGLWYVFCIAFLKRKIIVRAARHWSPHPIYLRLGSSDLNVFEQVFIEQEYSIVKILGDKLEIIIDAGANIGLTSIYLASLYPQARILAIEPEADNLELMILNTKYYESITCIHGALWGKDDTVNIESHNAASWAFRVTNEIHDNGMTIKGYTVKSLMLEHNIANVDLLKMDIEGSEYEVMSTSDAWIDHVDNIIVELHETIRPGCTELFFRHTKMFKTIATTKELTLISRMAS